MFSKDPVLLLIKLTDLLAPPFLNHSIFARFPVCGDFKHLKDQCEEFKGKLNMLSITCCYYCLIT